MNRLLLSIASDQTEVLIGYLYLSGHLYPPKHEFSLGKEICAEQGCVSPTSLHPAISFQVKFLQWS